jgi:hypothetical protein
LGAVFLGRPNIKPITQAGGTRLSQLPIASPSSGITFSYDPTLKTFIPSADQSLGPIFGEQAIHHWPAQILRRLQLPVL